MAACTAPTWPEVVNDDWGTYWVRLDREHLAQEFVDIWEGDHMAAERVGRRVMVRNCDCWGDGGLLVADPRLEHDDAVVYVEFEAYER